MARPRDPDLDRRILAAARELIDDEGIAAVTIEAIAARADVSRPTVYRRWGSRAALLFEAQTNASVAAPLPDTGTLRGDLLVALGQLTSVMEQADRVLHGEQFGQMIADAEFADRVWTQRWRPDREQVYVLWERAAERGEVDPSVDGHAVIDDLVAVCLFRVFLGHQSSSTVEIEAIVDRTMRGVRAQP